VLHSEDPRLLGVADSSGRVVVTDLGTAKAVAEVKVPPKHLEKARQVYLLADAENVFVAVDGPPDPKIAQGPVWIGGMGAPVVGGVQPLMQPGMGFRAVPVNGAIYAFNRKTGKARWHDEVMNGMVVVNHFADMPVVLFASHFARQSGGPFGPQAAAQKSVTNVVDKKSGKLVYESTDSDLYHTLNVDGRRGKMELVCGKAKISFQLAEAK
jgi:hypothetical protein